jgi:hypothetical protein
MNDSMTATVRKAAYDSLPASAIDAIKGYLDAGGSPGNIYKAAMKMSGGKKLISLSFYQAAMYIKEGGLHENPA